MPTYALLGATGATGTAILRSLLSNPPKELTLNILVRSKAKLLATFPDLETTKAFKINVIEGTPNDTTYLRQCLQDVDAIFGCIGTNAATPGMTLIYDTLNSVIEALKFHRQAQGTTASYKTPTVIQLRSASLNPAADLPWFGKQMAWFMFYHIYSDLERASDLLASTTTLSPGLLDYIFIDPPSLHDAEGATPTGYKLFTDGKEEKQEGAISYADLGAAFCEVAARRGEFGGSGVFVSATGEVRMTWGTLMGFMAQGLRSRVWG